MKEYFPLQLSAASSAVSVQTSVREPIGGPNVCRSRGRTFCCPGWAQRGVTGLCLVPLCTSGCGTGGHCIKPSLCVCDGGKIAPRCNEGSMAGGYFLCPMKVTTFLLFMGKPWGNPRNQGQDC